MKSTFWSAASEGVLDWTFHSDLSLCIGSLLVPLPILISFNAGHAIEKNYLSLMILILSSCVNPEIHYNGMCIMHKSHLFIRCRRTNGVIEDINQRSLIDHYANVTAIIVCSAILLCISFTFFDKCQFISPPLALTNPQCSAQQPATLLQVNALPPRNSCNPYPPLFLLVCSRIRSQPSQCGQPFAQHNHKSIKCSHVTILSGLCSPMPDRPCLLQRLLRSRQYLA